jgi:hypothetical protein
MNERREPAAMSPSPRAAERFNVVDPAKTSAPRSQSAITNEELRQNHEFVTAFEVLRKQHGCREVHDSALREIAHACRVRTAAGSVRARPGSTRSRCGVAIPARRRGVLFAVGCRARRRRSCCRSRVTVGRRRGRRLRRAERHGRGASVARVGPVVRSENKGRAAAHASVVAAVSTGMTSALCWHASRHIVPVAPCVLRTACDGDA